MAVFYDTGGGEIYAGLTRDEVLKAMREDSSEIDELEIFEVPGFTRIMKTKSQ